jgi:plastocyanin
MFEGGKRVRGWRMAVVFLLGMFLASLQAIAVSAYETVAPPTWSVIVGAENQSRVIRSKAFLPDVLRVNVGDSVVWTSRSSEIYTVTFLPPGQQLPRFDEMNPQQVNRVGGNVYDGKHYFNSGVLSNVVNSRFHVSKSYRLIFGVTGDFIYYCLLDPMMIGIVHVRPAGTPYPSSQQVYNQQREADGQGQVGQTKSIASNHYVGAGIGDGQVANRSTQLPPVVNHVERKITSGSRRKGIFRSYGDTKRVNVRKLFKSGYRGVIPGWLDTILTRTLTKSGTFKCLCDLRNLPGVVGMK